MGVITWRDVALATGAGADPAQAVRRAYREAGLPEPEHVVTLPSPAAGALVAAWLTGDHDARPALEASGLLKTPDLASADKPAEADEPAAASRPEISAGGGRVEGGAVVRGSDGGLSQDGSAGDGSLGEGVVEEARAVVRRLRAAGLRPGHAGRSVRHQVRTLPWERARAAAHAELGPTGWAAVWASTAGPIWQQVQRLVADIRGAMADVGGEALRRVTLDAVLGQHDAPWLAAFVPLGPPSSPGTQEPGGTVQTQDAPPPGEAGLRGLADVAQAAGWWWPYERVAVVTARPVELHLDELDRLHRAEGPALRYADGFALHAWHGMPVPAGFGAVMGRLTPARIRQEENAELRRVMLEHFGVDRYLAESGAEPTQSDETGTLWRIELPGDEPVVMVEVVNSTPEPDGTRRTYFLRVPPWVQRARQGVAWTFGLAEQDYIPQRET
ncbi:DUF6745 domain-containing protein [Nonomuraea pusilla]|uniref:DUF6745 domain-containing protein n=1 Tax=Nonomuraea pusilla TaxID=46177 RepID=A0A1H8E1M0_9ACTN|nr:hypothetical protein [Nonomuraea pusilla]SEN13479.1 hypothetical protein SAMN05660976_06885 [Nonomuraea pusilla]